MKETFISSIVKCTPTEIPPRSKYFALCYKVKKNEQVIMGDGVFFSNKSSLLVYLKKAATAMGKTKSALPQHIAVYDVVDRKTGKIKFKNERSWEDWLYFLV